MPTVTRYFEDFQVGTEAESPRRTITDADITLFAGLSGDHNPHHTDDIFAATLPFKRRIAHGALTFSISTGLSVRMAPPNPAVIAFYGVDKLRFVRPVFIGDTIQVRKRVDETEAKDERRGVVKFESTVVNQDNQVVLRYYDVVLLQRKPSKARKKRAKKKTSRA